MREQFITKRFNEGSRVLIDQANAIIEEYMADDYTLTLRQLYYVFVSRNLLPNRQKQYKRLGSVINDARLAGLIDWDAIEDRVRGLDKINSWSHPASIFNACVKQFHFDRWATQGFRMEVWPEKDAVSGVVARACDPWHVPYFACRGYTSQSAQHDASKRFLHHIDNGQQVIILHLGDHDPSGIDMTRDNIERFEMFLKPFGTSVEVRRIALNSDQVRKYNPPPNPVKMKDSRTPQYRKLHGDQSWELDALDPKVIVSLIEREIERVIDVALWDEAVAHEERVRKRMAKLVKPVGKWKKAGFGLDGVE